MTWMTDFTGCKMKWKNVEAGRIAARVKKQEVEEDMDLSLDNDQHVEVCVEPV